MDPLTMMLIGSAIGLGKSALIDAPKEKRQRELAAKTQELSPWTGIRAGAIEEADPFGSALKYGATGASMGAGNAQAAMDNEYKKAMIDNLKMQNQMGVGMPWDGINTGYNARMMG